MLLANQDRESSHKSTTPGKISHDSTVTPSDTRHAGVTREGEQAPYRRHVGSHLSYLLPHHPRERTHAGFETLEVWYM